MKAVSFSNHAIDYLKPYLPNQWFGKNLENLYYNPSNVKYDVPQGSILGY